MGSFLARACSATVALMLLGACATQQVAQIEPGQEPAIDTPEAGLWLIMDKAERRLRTSGKLVQDERLQAYVNELACRISEPHCNDVRVYVVRRPSFNATMAPNGYMAIWSGLILRTENEAQLAAVIGHELTHYIHRHSLARWNETKAASNTAVAVKLALALAGVGADGLELVNLLTHGYLASYSRDQEREADRVGFELARAEGFEGGEAAQIWENLVEEREAADLDTPDPYLSTHPPSEERMETLAAMGKNAPGGDFGSQRFHDIITPHLPDWLEDEVDLGRYERLQVLLDRFKANGRAPGLTWHYQGELYRRRAEDGDADKAVEAYRQALEHGSPLATTHRGLALALWETGDKAGAREAFTAYLDADPEADDRQMIEYYLERLGPEA